MTKPIGFVLGSLAAIIVLSFPIISQSEPAILLRTEWKAKPAIENRTPQIKEVKTGKHLVAAENSMPKRKTAIYLTVHHTGRSASKSELPDNLKNFQELMFGYTINYGNGIKKEIHLGDIPYHYFIDRKGNIGEGRELKFAAYSNTIYETPIENHITVVLDGDFNEDKPSSNQIDSLTNLLEHLAVKYNISRSNIKVHSDVAETECPGKKLKAKMADIDKNLASRGVK